MKQQVLSRSESTNSRSRSQGEEQEVLSRRGGVASPAERVRRRGGGGETKLFASRPEGSRNSQNLLWAALIILLVITVFLPRLFNLDAFLTADEPRWLANTTGFTTKLAHGQLDQLVQQPHPGITTQWLGALTVRYESWTARKLPLVIGQSLLILIIGYIFARLWGKPAGILLVLLLALNPFLTAHTRVYAMDSLLALFLLLSLGALLLWQKTNTTRYLILASFAAAAAFLSKLPGIIIVPFTALLFAWQVWESKSIKQLIKPALIWLVVFIISLGIILPSFAINPTSVVGDFTEFFRSDDYQSLHQFSPSYYLETLLFKTTPLQITALVVVAFTMLAAGARRTGASPTPGVDEKTPGVFPAPVGEAALPHHQFTFLLFAALFIIMMMLGAKKGDRYILPSFLALDAIVALTATWLISLKRKNITTATILILAIGLTWQAADTARLHPHYLAYVNPLTKPFLGDRRTGWGEGLDLAASYLNQKPNAKDLKVAAYFPTQFAYNFIGETVPAHQADHPNIDYVVLYRAMFQRGPDTWETDIIQSFQGQVPEKIIRLNNIEYAWIYKQ